MPTTSYDITPAGPEEWSSAFQLALRHVPDDDRFTRVANALALLSAGEIDPAGIFVARTSSGLAGVQVCILLRGSSGLLWLPQVDPAFSQDGLADRLVQAALHWLKQRGAKLAQALLHPSDLPDASALLRCGFSHVTDLQYLSHDLTSLPLAPTVHGLRLEPYSAATETAFHQTLLRTYDGTLDCPELNGVRTIDEIIDGHRAQGIWRAESWWLASLGDAPAGVVLVTELPDGDGWDLSYVGIMPAFRRQGLGRALAIHAMRAVHGWGATQLMLAVDQRNVPAETLYKSLGFCTTGCRSVLLQIF